jgi:hypothetical protein
LGQPGRDNEFGYGLANAKSVIGVIQSDIIFSDIDADNSHDDTISDTIVGKEITVTGALGTRQKTIGDISQICSEPCKFIGGETIKFTGSGPVPAPVITNQFGEFKTTFIAPPTAGTWEIQAHFAGNFDYRASDSQVLKYKTVLDTDNDGIANNVDLNPFVSSFKFSDQNNRGITIGEIDIISNLDIALVDELDDNGVRVKTYEGIGKASIFPCNSDSSLSFFKNTTFILTCNNIHLNVTNGNVDAKLISAEGITFNVNVPQGNDLEFNRLSLIFKASPSNTVVLKIIDDKGNQYDLAPGQTLDISSSSKKKIEMSSIAKCNPGDFAIGGGFVLGGNATIISSKLLATENGWNATAFVFGETRISDNSTGNVTANVVCLDDSISSP